MYTTINGTYDNGHVLLEEVPPTQKRMRVLITFVEESRDSISDESILKSTKVAENEMLDESKLGFSERWLGKFKIDDTVADERFDYLIQRYQL